ncbi:hypothetical protein FRB91_008836 [Serendipita sp. 411]|nr:hypothetical protein FRC15_004744 [Serendipita sp. 397]KAG8776804.1 hypothetical protein FRC16_004386 [Serendipita sp. 398]KAG8842347.1 hypothetical protein FRC20_004494 [Serendipita sp. 405]KAG8850726.1 hypothetical protein FRB91_008836 [Serendipita sp. 411]
MRFSISLALTIVTAINAQTIFQKLSINGVDQGSLTGIRVPSFNTSITDLTSNALACNTGYHQPVSSKVVQVPAGSIVGTKWGHVIGGAMFAGDTGNPIAENEKGPLQVYLASVTNAVTAGTSGLKWFKVASVGLSNGMWAVDTMITNAGWWYFTMPVCIKPGQYLMRVELIALHKAKNPGGAEFYLSCAQVEVTGKGTLAPTITASFPGTYTATDPGILVDIYDENGTPNGGGYGYTSPGPSVVSCDDS